MTTPYVRPLALLLASLLVGSMGRGQTLTDLSESGEALHLGLGGQGSAASPRLVGLLPNGAWDVLDFEVRGAQVGQVLHFAVVDAGPATEELAPSVSFGEFQWHAAEDVRLEGHRLRFSVTPTRERFVVRLRPLSEPDAAYYPWSRFVDYMQGIALEPRAQVTQVGTSIQGRPLYRIVIDDASQPSPKETVLVVVRQHGDEYGSSYLLEGMLDLLLDREPGGFPVGTSEPTATLERLVGSGLRTRYLRRMRWVIYPFMNPDGGVMEQRHNANGVDLNRDWDRNGANANQEPETFAIQADIEALDALYGFDIAGDHHGWNFGNHGGFRYAPATFPSNTTLPEYQEARKDTRVIAYHDPSQTNWIENGGTVGMLRVEMFLRSGFLIHTPEYDSVLSSQSHFYAKGGKWVKAMVDTLFAPRFTGATGEALVTAKLGDGVYVTVDDEDENVSPAATDSVQVTVFDPASGDVEVLTLPELARGGFFRSATPLLLSGAPASSGNGVLETSSGATLIVRYTDDDYPRDESRASLRVR